MDTTEVGRKTELAKMVARTGFLVQYTKFKKISKKHGIFFKKPCKQGYALEDEKGKSIENICKNVTFSVVKNKDSKGLRTPYTKACIEEIILKDDVNPGEVYCAICPLYIGNVLSDLSRKIDYRYN